MVKALSDALGSDCCCEVTCEPCPHITTIGVSGEISAYIDAVFSPNCGDFGGGTVPFSTTLLVSATGDCAWDNADEVGVQGYVPTTPGTQYELMCNSNFLCSGPFIHYSLSPPGFVMWVASTFIPTGERTVAFMVTGFQGGPDIVDGCPVTSSFGVGSIGGSMRFCDDISIPRTLIPNASALLTITI